MSNFTFLLPEWPSLHEAASKAEVLAHADHRAAHAESDALFTTLQRRALRRNWDSGLIPSEKSYDFSDGMARPRSSNNLENRILSRIQEQEAGKVFASVEFLDLGSRAAVDQALARLCRAGAIHRARRGLFYIPRVSQHFGPLKAAADKVAQAIARRDGLRIQEGGAYAANAMGLTEQVPARTIYDTDGPSRKVSIMGSKAVIEFKHRSPRRMAGAGRVTGMVISALANIGRRHVTRASLERLRRELKPEHKRQLLADLALAPAWMHPHLRHIAEEPESTP